MAKKDVFYWGNGDDGAAATKKEDKKMKKIEYDFFYDGRIIAKENVICIFGKNWKKKFVRNQFGEWLSGGYKACPRE